MSMAITRFNDKEGIEPINVRCPLITKFKYK